MARHPPHFFSLGAPKETPNPINIFKTFFFDNDFPNVNSSTFLLVPFLSIIFLKYFFLENL